MGDGITEKQWFCLCIEDDQAWWTRSIVFGMSGKFMFVGYCLLCIAFAVVKYMHIRVTFNFLIGSWIFGVPLPIQAPTIMMPVSIFAVINASLKPFLVLISLSNKACKNAKKISAKRIEGLKEEVDEAVKMANNLGTEGSEFKTADPNSASNTVEISEEVIVERGKQLIQEKVQEKVENTVSQRLDEGLDELMGGKKSEEDEDDEGSSSEVRNFTQPSSQ